MRMNAKPTNSATQVAGDRPKDRKQRILIVEDQPITRYGLARLIGSEPDMISVGQAMDRISALELFATCEVDLVVVDLILGKDDGLELVKELVARRSDIPILVFSFMDEALFAARALRAGAHGYLMKDATGDVILAAMRGVLSGEICVSKAVTDAALRRVAGLAPSQADDPLAELSDRELQIFLLIGKGHDMHQIAEQLYISIHTAQAHREHIKNKLKFEHSKELLRYASQWVNSKGC